MLLRYPSAATRLKLAIPCSGAWEYNRALPVSALGTAVQSDWERHGSASARTWDAASSVVRGHALFARHQWVPRLQAVAAEVGDHVVEVRDLVVDDAIVGNAGSGNDTVIRELSDGRAGLAIIVFSNRAKVAVHVVGNTIHDLDLHSHANGAGLTRPAIWRDRRQFNRLFHFGMRGL